MAGSVLGFFLLRKNKQPNPHFCPSMTKNQSESRSSLLGNILTESLEPNTSNALNSNSPTNLQDLSPRDKPWDDHRAAAETVQSYYSGSNFHRYAERGSECSRKLEFDLRDGENGHVGVKLTSARFCRLRWCPVCQWRRALRWKANGHQVLPQVIADFPTHRWLFLTLTARNVPISDLRTELKKMQDSFTRLADLKAWPAVGWLRSTEVTRSADGSAHHHFHVLLLVPKNYFKRDYLSQAKWQQMWKKAMRLDYDPQVDVQAISEKKDATVVIPELLKYCVKESDLLADREWLIELTKQLHKTRSIATGGVLKKYFSALEKEPEDLIGLDGENEEESYGSLRFDWKTGEKKYQMVE
jgi:plasmid rolling circle replication initiator protein Rep